MGVRDRIGEFSGVVEGRSERMGIAIVSDPQSRANLLMELLHLDPSVRRMRARLRVVHGTEDRLLVHLSHGGRELRFERGPEWAGDPLDRTKAWLKEELLRESVT